MLEPLGEEAVAKAIKHIKLCDDLFDGRGGTRPDREFAYFELRVLTLELLEQLGPNADTTTS